MQRIFDVIVSLIIILLLSPVLIITSIVVKRGKYGSVIFKQYRVGQDNKEFLIFKFRTMYEGAPIVPTELLENPEQYITPIGRFLRKTSIDELPQIFNILKGDMTFVGPRPVINSEEVLLKLRSEAGINKLMPGITGWAQVNGRDYMTIEEKIYYEAEYLKNKCIWLDIKILFITIIKVLKKENIK